MADLKKYMWEGVQKGMAFDLYLNRWPKIGDGQFEIAESLHVKIIGNGNLLGTKFEFSIEVIMPDTSLFGKCTVILNGSREVGCAFNVIEGTLIINHPIAQIKIQDNDKKWTWVHVNHPVIAWIGAWPSGIKMAHEDNFGDIV